MLDIHVSVSVRLFVRLIHCMCWVPIVGALGEVIEGTGDANLQSVFTGTLSSDAIATRVREGGQVGGVGPARSTGHEY